MSKPSPAGLDRKRGARLVTLALAAVLAAGAGVALKLLLAERSRPVIVALDPSIGEPGGVVRVVGRNFGQERGESRVEIAGVAPTASSYLSWNDRLVELRVPVTVSSGLVYVQTRSGRSRPRLFMNRDRLPLRPQGLLASKSGPAIEGLSAAQGTVGSLLTISGLNFGANRGEGRVEFAWTGDSGFSNPGPEQVSAFARAEELSLAYESWTDKEIRVRVPDGAASGGVRVLTEKGASDAVFFRVEGGPGTKVFHDRRTYAVSYFVSLTKVKASGGKPVIPAVAFALVRLSKPLADANGKSQLSLLTDAQATQLEPLRQGLAPVVSALEAKGILESTGKFVDQTVDKAMQTSQQALDAGLKQGMDAANEAMKQAQETTDAALKQAQEQTDAAMK
ncbi:MAG TPA: IPT/TIG domain-containing protein, partial [Spirochaetia bacterium]|nr:IPT/TIG domain-containing protein [Spirochaetia bacterium]